MHESESTPSRIGHCPPVVDVRLFREAAIMLLADDEPIAELSEGADISTEGLRYATPFTRIENEVEKALAQMPEARTVAQIRAAVESIPVTPASVLNATPVVDLQSLRPPLERERDGRMKKEVNYLIRTQQESEAMSAAGEEIAADEIILSVAQFHPMKNKKHQEYLVLGSQPLTALRDKIYCLADKVLEGVSSAPAVFLIEGNTYIDTRSIDPNRPLPFSLGEPGIRRMEEALFSSLAVRIGVQYKYIHQGGCEHTIAFTEIRMSMSGDVKAKSAYPIQTFQYKVSYHPMTGWMLSRCPRLLRRRKCRVCDNYAAKWVTYNDRLCPETPCFFCDYCYRPLHYNAEGKLLYSDFEVYPYHHDA